jgi:hypothetical protein
MKAHMGSKIHLRSKISQVLLICSLVATASASLDDSIQMGQTLIKLQPGTHTFSGANVSGSLAIEGASAGETTVTTVQCTVALTYPARYCTLGVRN